MGKSRLCSEESRLDALRRYRILDTTPEEAFDDLVHLAALVCRAPISLLSLVDQARQWFKAKEGIEESELPRESAFCAHAILGTDVLVVPDTHGDARFQTNPLVLGAPGIRFYAGAPLVTPEGYGLGTLCVIDRVPRSISPEEIRALRALAREVMVHLEHRRILLEVTECASELEAFSSTVAHDLRAPLRAMRGIGEIVREDYSGRPLGTEGVALLDRMTDAAGRMDALIEGLLAYSRVSRQEMILEPVALGPLLDRVLEDLGPDLASRQASVEVSSDLPVVRAHRLMLGQALINLVSNGVKFVAPGTAPRVTVSATRAKGKAILAVVDNGIGIAPELQERLFRPFSRLPGADAAFPGTGFGLAIVRKAVERMGGRVGVESAPGQGSRFWVELPLASGA